MECWVRFANVEGLYEFGFPSFDIDHRAVRFVPLAYKAFVKFHRGRLVLEGFSRLESLQTSSISPEFPLLCRHLDL
jgi:hypothetical protein